MKISYNWLKEYIDLKTTPQQLADLLTSRGLEVEAIESQSQGFDKVVVGEILEKKQHPGADRLSLCKVNTGKETLDIVCGAQNMKAGDRVAVAQVGANLPNGLKIQEGKIRGERSQGMLCSEEELKLKDKSEGILILSKTTPLGQPLAEALHRDDTILTLKLTANRGDCQSHFGLAREISAALSVAPKEPKASPASLTGASIAVKCGAGEDAPQFLGVLIEGVKVGPSPDWLKNRLEAIGQRSISNIVDATNFVMMEFGHPVHAYDADKIKGTTIEVRNAKKGEKVSLLDSTTIECDGTELVIADGSGPVGLAGVMGGGNSEVSDGTKRVYLECAEFNAIRVRRAAQKHQKRTEASARFEKGIDPKGLERVMNRLASLVIEVAGGKVVGGSSAKLKTLDAKSISVSSGFFEKFLGMPVAAADAEKILKGLSCAVTQKGNEWSVQPPSFRRDLEIKEDLAEEIARTVGYDQIPARVPKLTEMPSTQNGDFIYGHQVLMDRAKDYLVDLGLQETLNFSFTSKAWLEKLGFQAGPKVQNPLSEEHEVLVPSLLPGMIKNAMENTRHHFGSEPLAIRLFEIRPTFSAKGEVCATPTGETGIDEKLKLVFAISGPQYGSALRAQVGEVDFFDAKAILDTLVGRLAAKGVRYQAAAPSKEFPEQFFHPGMVMDILAGAGPIGKIGRLHPGIQSDLKLKAPLYLCELDFAAVAKLSRPAWQVAGFKSWSPFPTMERDFAFVVETKYAAEKVLQTALKAGKPLVKSGKIFDHYQGAQVAAGKISLAIRVFFESSERSLTEEEVETSSKQIVASVQKETGAELR